MRAGGKGMVAMPVALRFWVDLLQAVAKWTRVELASEVGAVLVVVIEEAVWMMHRGGVLRIGVNRIQLLLGWPGKQRLRIDVWFWKVVVLMLMTRWELVSGMLVSLLDLSAEIMLGARCMWIRL